LKQRTKKLLFILIRVLLACRVVGEGEQVEVFWFFFSKKNILFSLACRSAPRYGFAAGDGVPRNRQKWLMTPTAREHPR
jgi:hypothetical protein